MKLVDKYDFPEYKFSLYFLAKLKEDNGIEPGTEEAHKFLWNFDGVTLELTHNHGTEDDENLKYNNGNVEPNRGFGHIAFCTEDVYASCEILEKNGVKFQKKPDDGRMKGIAFALDPDGYWIEILARSPTEFKGYNLSQTMIRIKDPKKSLHFYRDLLGMETVDEKCFLSFFAIFFNLIIFVFFFQKLFRHFNDFSLYFLASKRKNGEDADKNTKTMFHPILELTHNHGTENDENFSYHNGNTEPRGFGHIGFLVDDLDKSCEYLESKQVSFKKKPSEGNMRGIAFVYDPDGYWIEIIQRSVSF